MVSPGIVAADDRVIRGDYTVRSGVTIDDNIKIYGGALTVHGRVAANVDQYGRGSVVVGAAGHVEGNIKERDAGRVAVSGDVDGNVEEGGTGGVLLGRSGHVDVRGDLYGNIEEYDAGPVAVGRHAHVDGNVYERREGRLEVRGSVEGDVSEAGRGGAT
jgi:cytoskeletal protein CcmA (bactofilin family)